MQTLDLFKALSDEIRLRILRVVSSSELSVAEMVSVLGLPQSTVSRHLKPLRDAELVEARRDGTSVYYRKGPAFDDGALAEFMASRLAELPFAAEDHASMRRVMEGRRERSRAFFDRIAGSYGTLTQPGGGWQALSAGLAAGFAGQRVADLGAGQGELTLMVAPFAREVIAVDQSRAMLDALQAGAAQAGLSERVSVAEGDLESLPLEASSVDAAFLSQALHHAAHPEGAIREAARILRPGGRLIVLDLVRHEEEWVREQWADLWLGFEPDDVAAWMRQAGLKPVHQGSLAGSTPELAVLLSVGARNSQSV